MNVIAVSSVMNVMTIMTKKTIYKSEKSVMQIVTEYFYCGKVELI